MASKKPFNKDAVVQQWFATTAGAAGKNVSAYEDAFPNLRKLRWQNAAGTGYVDGISVNGSDQVVIGTPVAFTGNMTVINDGDGDAALNITTNAGSAVNALTLANGATGVAPSLKASGETNVSLVVGPKGTGTTTILDGAGSQVIICAAGTATAVNEVTFTNAAASGQPGIAATGDDTNIGLTIGGKGTGKLYLGASNSAGVKFVGDQPILDSSDNELIKFVKTTTAVNEVTITNQSTGVAPSIKASGETNVGLVVGAKGTGTTVIADGNGNEVIVAAAAVTSAVNEVTFTNAATLNSPGIAATGGDTNVSLQLSGKGTGKVLVGDSGTASCTGTGATSTTTSSKQVSLLTTAALTTAAAAAHTITMTNTKCLSSAAIVGVTVYRGTATTGVPQVTKVTPGTGTMDIEITNTHASVAINGTLLVVVNVLA